MCDKNLSSCAPLLTLGCDPEIFFEKEGKIIGAEKVIKNTLGASGFSGSAPTDHINYKAIILDGVQAEFNPRAHHCREELGGELACAFRALREHLKGMKDITISMRSVVQVSKAELDTLSERSKILGCAPSKNIHNMTASIKVNPNTYRKRSAGGHIHLGVSSAIQQRAEDLVKLMDVLVGNTSVLMDRDPLAAERRKVYGRAGEHRTPPHGVEYRTLSNFWLKAYPLMSLVMGLSRLAVWVLNADIRRDLESNYEVKSTYSHYGWDAPSELLSLVDMKDITKAINTNDFELALSNFHKIKPFMMDHAKSNVGITNLNIEGFEWFVRKIYEEGLDYWFPQDTMEHWSNLPWSPGGYGAESFLTKVQLEKEGARGHATFGPPKSTITAGV